MSEEKLEENFEMDPNLLANPFASMMQMMEQLQSTVNSTLETMDTRIQTLSNQIEDIKKRKAAQDEAKPQ